MEARATTLADERFFPQKPINGKLHPSQNSDVDNKDEMAVRRSSPITTETEAILARLDKMPGSKSDLGAWSRTLATMAVVVVGWFGSALYIAKSTETEIKVSNAILTTELNQTRHDFDEYRRNTERDMKLMDERFRQISIALEARGLKLPIQ